jgi:hypothetical protein
MSGKKIGMLLGVILLIVGVLGFIPGGLGIVGPDGVFATNMLHDLVHLVTGLIFIIVAAKSAGSVGTAFKVFGVIYVLVALLGFFMAGDDGMLLGLHTNGADHWLHLVLGIVFFALGFSMSKKQMPGPSMGGMA